MGPLHTAAQRPPDPGPQHCGTHSSCPIHPDPTTQTISRFRCFPRLTLPFRCSRGVSCICRSGGWCSNDGQGGCLSCPAHLGQIPAGPRRMRVLGYPFCPPITLDGDAHYLKDLSQQGEGNGEVGNEIVFKACRGPVLTTQLSPRMPPPSPESPL